jgi:adenosylmethionine---8-amino-7-oxononanoate aminotransferase
MSLSDRDQAVLWHPYTQMQTAPAPLAITHAEGVWLHTAAGRRILDGISSWWVNIHGHAHPRLNAALARQAAQLEHVIFAGCTHAPAVELAEALLKVAPPGLARVFYSDNGSTAVEAAMKMALQFWANQNHHQRRRFLSLVDAYHGDTVGAMSASGRSVFNASFVPIMFHVEHFRDLDHLSRLLNDGKNDVAAVLIEPMLQGAGGMRMWTPDFVRGVRGLCTDNGALLIADEVLTGFGRTGKMFACEHAQITPDILCLSKGLTAGYMPLGATLTTAVVYHAFLSDDRSKTFFHGHSYTANPLACAVAVESLRMFAEQPILERVQRLEQQMREELEPLRRLDHVADVRVLGGVGVVELKGGGYLDQQGSQLAAAFLAEGLLLRPLGNVLYFMPPYAITEQEAGWALALIRAKVEECNTHALAIQD